MPLGGLAPLPLRLGGTAQNGLTAVQHARIAADWLALRRSMPLAVWTYTLASGKVTIHGYRGQNGAGIAHAWTSTANAAGDVTWEWEPRVFVDPYENSAPIAIKHAKASIHGSTRGRAVVAVFANSVRVRVWNAAGTPMDSKVTVVVW